MTPLEKQLQARIAQEGPLPFAAFMSLALYDPKFGYYTSAATRQGWRGHYLTSPELDPAFGELWCRGFEQIWVTSGSPTEFTVIEIGPGEGSFAAAVLASAQGPFARSLRYVLVERSPVVQERQRARLSSFEAVSWARSVTELEAIAHGCIFSNEVLDNLPVHLVECRDGKLLEVCVDNGPGGLEWTLREPTNPQLLAFFDRMDTTVPDGHRVEVALAAESFVARTAAAIASGALVYVDYGAGAAELFARPQGTLVCYSQAGVDDRPLERPGEKDITSHANWTAVEGACLNAGFELHARQTQRNVLESLGLHELHEQLKDAHDVALSERRGADALGALSRRQALGALSDPAGLGRLEVLVATKQIPAPAFVAR